MSKESSTADRSVNKTMDVPNRAMDAATSVAEHSKDGSVALLAGGTLLVRAIRSRRKRGRAVLQALLGVGLVGFGLRQRRSEESIVPTADIEPTDRGETGTSEERAESHQPDANPRGTSGEPDVETETAPDEGSVQFDEDQTEGERSGPQLDEPSAGDPRLDEAEPTEVDLSDASLADEASEAAGPTAEQAQPTQTDETEPERSPPEDASTTQTDESDQSDDAADDDDESALDGEDDDSA